MFHFEVFIFKLYDERAHITQQLALESTRRLTGQLAPKHARPHVFGGAAVLVGLFVLLRTRLELCLGYVMHSFTEVTFRNKFRLAIVY